MVFSCGCWCKGAMLHIKVQMYCHRKIRATLLDKIMVYYPSTGKEYPMAKRKRRNFTPSLKPKLFLRLSMVKVRRSPSCVGDTTSAMNNFQNGSDSSLKMRRPSLNLLISSRTLLRSGLHTLSNSLGG